MITFKIFVVSLVIVLNNVSLQKTNPVVQIEDGKIVGVWETLINNRKIAVFKGVPYAQPPIGEHRFKNPERVTPWSGIRNATVYGAQCLQLSDTPSAVLGDEDCLFLNIFSPDLNSKASLPVLVFIHGGDFVGGSGDLYDPSRLIVYDMIVITINYRLGPLGFFSTGDDVVPGNFGLKDQAFALQWIQRNIKSFGGDPRKITLSGHSTGAACVYYHYLSPLSYGTFRNGIAFSGSALAPWALDYCPLEKGRNLASVVGCTSTTSDTMLQCLKTKPGADIIRAQLQLKDKEFDIYQLFQPVIESTRVHNPFITENPYQAAVAGKMQKLPLILGTTHDEGLVPAAAFQSAPELLPSLNKRWPELASLFLSYNKTLPDGRSEEVAQKIKDFYFEGKPVSLETFWPLVRMETDRVFHVDIGKLALIHAKYSGARVQMYDYSFPGAYSFSNLLTNNSVVYGAAHTDDILHLFKLYGLDSDSAEDVDMNTVMGDLVYGYVSTGVPKLPKKIRWDAVTPGCKELRYLEILSPNQFRMSSSNNFGNRTFWDSLGFNENENYHYRRC